MARFELIIFINSMLYWSGRFITGWRQLITSQLWANAMTTCHPKPNTIDSRPLKVRNCSDFLPCRWPATYFWKAFDEGYNFVLDLIPIGGLHTKLWATKVTEVPTLGNSGLPFGSPGTKHHLDATLVASHKVYYKGEGGGFPQVWAMMSLVSSSLLVIRPSTKSALTMH
jgi:hypothetical protein